MFLDEINKNELEYLEKLKSLAKETFIDFYGEIYREKIEDKIDNTPIICFDRKQIDKNYALNKIDKERDYLMIEWFSKTFDIDNDIIVGDLLKEIETIKDEMDFSENNEELILIISDILNNNIFKNENINNEKIEELIDNYNLNYKDTFEKLLNLEDEIYDFYEELNDFNDFEDLKNNNIYVQNIYKNLNEFEQDALLKLSNNFIKRESRGLFACHYNENEDIKLLFLPDLKILDLSIFMHELNHAISNRIENNNRFICSNTGINKREENFETNKVKEKYHFLNEVITDYFVSKMDIKSLEDKKLLMNSSFKSTYSRCFILIEPFMNKYFKETKECFINSDTELFEKIFGEYNLEALEQIFKDFSGYSQTMLEKNGINFKSFKEGFNEALKIDNDNVPNYLPSYVTKYYNSFLKMQNLMDNIARYQKNNGLELNMIN